MLKKLALLTSAKGQNNKICLQLCYFVATRCTVLCYTHRGILLRKGVGLLVEGQRWPCYTTKCPLAKLESTLHAI